MSTVRAAAEEIIGNLKRVYTAPYTKLSGENTAVADAVFEEVQKLLGEIAVSPLDA